MWVFVTDGIVNPADALVSQRYPGFQDVNVMMLIGFGFLMTFIRSYAWSAISYTFFINAFITQAYPLLFGLWSKAFNSTWNNPINLTWDITTLILGADAVAAMLVSFGGVIGRVGPKDLLVLACFNVIGYSLNEEIVFFKIKMVDPGASSTVHTFGCYFGLTACLVLSKRARPITNVKISYISNIFAFIGTLFLVLYFPSFNYAVSATNSFEQNLIVVNTVMSLAGSVLGTFIISSLGMGRGLEMENILNATIAGGIIIGAPSAFIYRPGLALFIGVMGGVVSTICFHKLSPKLLDCIGLYDTCGIHNLHGIPGLLGGIWSAIIISFYNTGYDTNIAAMYSGGHFLFDPSVSFLKQGGLQIAGTLCSLGLAIGFGFLGGVFVSHFYDEKNKFFYLDTEYFENAHFSAFYRADPGENRYLNQREASKKLEMIEERP